MRPNPLGIDNERAGVEWGESAPLGRRRHLGGRRLSGSSPRSDAAVQYRRGPTQSGVVQREIDASGGEEHAPRVVHDNAGIIRDPQFLQTRPQGFGRRHLERQSLGGRIAQLRFQLAGAGDVLPRVLPHAHLQQDEIPVVQMGREPGGGHEHRCGVGAGVVWRLRRSKQERQQPSKTLHGGLGRRGRRGESIAGSIRMRRPLVVAGR